MRATKLFPHRISIFAGHYGVGKTEVCTNLAMALAAEQGEAVRAQERDARLVLADLDIVNPYFRARECRALLASAGVRLLSSSQACADADIPALPAEIFSILQDRRIRGLLDLGGDPVGARVLARFTPQLQGEDSMLYCVINANRPEVASKARAAEYLRAIEQTTGLACGGLINNTHLCGETDEGEILKGAALCDAVAEETGLPVVCHIAEARLAKALPTLSAPVFGISIYLRKPWERRPVA